MNKDNMESSSVPATYIPGDIIKYERWEPGDLTPEIFECMKYDEDWGVVWWDDGCGHTDSIGIAYIRLATKEEIKNYKWQRKEI
jgi:hypothetical protein